jgi:AsmA protein
MRASGQVVVEGRRVFGALGFDVLPLPPIRIHSADPLPVGWLRNWQAALRIEAAQLQVGLVPVLAAGSADVTLRDGVLTVARAVGARDGGTLTGEASLDAAADPPRVSVRLQAAGLALSGPVFGTPVDVVAGHGDVSATVSAAGYSPAALLATLSGSGSLRVHDGLVSGFDLAAAGHALALPNAVQATSQARSALLGGNSSFDTLEAPMTISGGVVSATADMASAAGTGTLTGSFDLQNAGVDVRLALTPFVAGGTTGPVLGLRLTGPARALVRTPEMAGSARWLADRAQ